MYSLTSDFWRLGFIPVAWSCSFSLLYNNSLCKCARCYNPLLIDIWYKKWCYKHPKTCLLLNICVHPFWKYIKQWNFWVIGNVYVQLLYILPNSVPVWLYQLKFLSAKHESSSCSTSFPTLCLFCLSFSFWLVYIATFTRYTKPCGLQMCVITFPPFFIFYSISLILNFIY